MIDLVRSSFKIAISSLLVSKVRSLLTVLGIVIGVASVIILVAVGSGLREMVAGQFASIGANLLMVVPGRVSGSNISSFSSLSNQGKFKNEDLRNLASLEGVSAVTADLDEFVPVHFRGQTMTSIVGGASDRYFDVFNWPMAEGRYFSAAEQSGGKKVVIVGNKVKSELFNGSPVGQILAVGQQRYQIVGVLTAKGGFGQFDWDSTVYMPLSAAERFFGQVGKLDMLYVKTQDTSVMKAVSARIELVLSRRLDKDDFSVLEQGDLFRAADRIFGAVTLALGGIAAISLLVGGIGIMNIMLVSVSERTREIGLRKAVGASFRDILWQFLIEAVVVASIGGLIGVLLGFLGSFILDRFIATDVTSWSVVLAFSFSALVGVVFGIAPAYKAAKLDPIEALRYE